GQNNIVIFSGGNYMVFGDRLKALREEKEITQKHLGKVINISARVIGYYESNDRFPKDEIILKAISDYFNVSVDYLIGRTSLRSPQSEYVAETKASYSLNIEGLPAEAIKMIEDYIELIRLKYDPNFKFKR
ncbi:MAG: helix-turn-helix domain-containing protein, partial [Ruminiclostridium sp.]